MKGVKQQEKNLRIVVEPYKINIIKDRVTKITPAINIFIFFLDLKNLFKSLKSF